VFVVSAAAIWRKQMSITAHHYALSLVKSHLLVETDIKTKNNRHKQPFAGPD